MRIPLGRGTIGYVVENADWLAADQTLYLADNSLGDLRGAVPFEDQLIGHINIILIPVVPSPSDGSLGDVRLLLSLFLPVPCVFTMQYAKEFAQHVYPIGQELLLLWEQRSYREVAHTASTPTFHPGSLYDAVDSIADSVAHSGTGDAECEEKPEAVFPWVGVLKTEPVADPLSNIDSGVNTMMKSWTEPSSFARSRSVECMNDMLSVEWRSFDRWSWPRRNDSHVFWTRTAIRFDRDNLVDLVFPLAADQVVVGQIRMHLSRLLMKAACPTDDDNGVNSALDRLVDSLNANAPLARARGMLGRVIDGIRRETRCDPVSIKTARELEHWVFDDFLRSLWRPGMAARRRGPLASIARAVHGACIGAIPDRGRPNVGSLLEQLLGKSCQTQ